jgi:predicted RNase H-like HicB family nuclease
MIGKPRYQKGNYVTFIINAEKKVGKIGIVDAYGTFEQTEEASYDIFVDEEKCLYKHVPESKVIGIKELSYKNYNGTMEYSWEDRCLFGTVAGIKSLISYEGNSISELEQDFRNAIDEYLEDCNDRGVQAELPQKYDDKAYLLAKANTKYNADGRAVIETGDEWLDETEWDDVYEQLKADCNADSAARTDADKENY